MNNYQSQPGKLWIAEGDKFRILHVPVRDDKGTYGLLSYDKHRKTTSVSGGHKDHKMLEELAKKNGRGNPQHHLAKDTELMKLFENFENDNTEFVVARRWLDTILLFNSFEILQTEKIRIREIFDLIIAKNRNDIDRIINPKKTN